jgi:transposase
MAKREWSMDQIAYFTQLLKTETSDRKVAKIIGCRRALVKELRASSDTELITLLKSRSEKIPALRTTEWTALVNFTEILSLIEKGHELKRIWEDSAKAHTTYSNFWKYLQRHYGHLLKATVTLRDFTPGSQCEVDWAGDKISWFNEKGVEQKAHVFVGILCFSQFLFAFATEDEKQANFIWAHEKFFRFLGGTPEVTVSDNLKTGVKQPDRYDPELNPVYEDFAHHYHTSVVPARVYRPKDKALVEGAVKIISRYFKWKNRNRRFTSLNEINEALLEVYESINARTHSRFKVSRQHRFNDVEKSTLRALPENFFEQVEWKDATLHPDCTIEVDAAYYSAPKELRGKRLRIKITKNLIEIFNDLMRVATHPRDRKKHGNRVIENSHLPENSRAYRENTAQGILSQARFVSPILYGFIDELFQLDTLGNLRRALGLVRYARHEIESYGREAGESRVNEAVLHLQRFNQMRVKVFKETIERLRKNQYLQQTKIDREIIRSPGNPMLRKAEKPSPAQEPLPGILIPFPERTK